MQTEALTIKKANKFLSKVTVMDTKEKKLARLTVDMMEHLLEYEQNRKSYIWTIGTFDPKLASKMEILFLKFELMHSMSREHEPRFLDVRTDAGLYENDIDVDSDEIPF